MDRAPKEDHIQGKPSPEICVATTRVHSPTSRFSGRCRPRGGSAFVTAAASAPIPETPERRAKLTREIAEATGLDEPTLERLVRRFYETARRDELLGPVFSRVSDWEAHVVTIATFWSSVALMTGRYHGQPMRAHIPLGLTTAHFARWLALWTETVPAECPPQAVDYLQERAKGIARSVELGIAVQRDELPVTRPARRTP
jgi:hemoglobin